MILLISSLLIFAAVSLGAYAVYVDSVTARSPVTLRLRELRAGRPLGSVVYGARPPLLLKLIAQVGGFLPGRNGSDALRAGLVRAGFRRPEAVLVFLGLKVVLAVALPLLWIAAASIAARSFGNTFLIAVMASVVGFYLPTLYVGIRQSQRHEQVLLGLPDALDLMVICVEAGLGVAAALQRVATEMRIANPVLAGELAQVAQETQTGTSRTEALRNLAERTGVQEVYSLVAMLIQTDSLGTSVAVALRVHADSMRTKRRQRAEQLARKASVKLAFPLVLLVFPALLVVLLGPAIIQLLKALAVSQ
jgi:tight adherence protein C